MQSVHLKMSPCLAHMGSWESFLYDFSGTAISKAMCSDRFERLSDVMEDGLAADFQLPEVEGHLEGFDPALLEAEEVLPDGNAGHAFSPARALGQGKPAEPVQARTT